MTFCGRIGCDLGEAGCLDSNSLPRGDAPALAGSHFVRLWLLWCGRERFVASAKPNSSSLWNHAQHRFQRCRFGAAGISRLANHRQKSGSRHHSRDRNPSELLARPTRWPGDHRIASCRSSRSSICAGDHRSSHGKRQITVRDSLPKFSIWRL